MEELINKAFTFKSTLQNKENRLRMLHHVYDVDNEKQLTESPILATDEQYEAFVSIMYPNTTTIKLNVPVVDYNRLDFVNKIDLDNLEFNTSSIDGYDFMCRYNERILFLFDIMGVNAIVKRMFEKPFSITIDKLKEFPDFIVLQDTI